MASLCEGIIVYAAEPALPIVKYNISQIPFDCSHELLGQFHMVIGRIIGWTKKVPAISSHLNVAIVRQVLNLEHSKLICGKGVL